MTRGFSMDGKVAPGRSRWIVAQAWGAAIVVYAVAIATATPRALMWINDIAWALASLAACLLCVRTARRIDPLSRAAWMWLAVGCGSWFVGQLHWNINELLLGVMITYPNVGQVFYSSFAACTIAGILQMPQVRGGSPFTLRHIGNIGLVVCCLVAASVLGLLELLLTTTLSFGQLLGGGIHSLLLAGAFLVALFALWTYRWNRAWTPMLLLTLGAGVYSVTNLIHSHALLSGTYVESDLINASWCAVFGCFAWAAHERWWLELHPTVEAPQRMLAREHLLEAIIPALLIATIVGVALVAAPNVSPRALGIAAVVFILFAIILGMREAWIQSESQRLNDELIDANERLALANADLQASEQRYRELNRELEARVAQRTTELEKAYEELEGFAYAVAHDLKSPLRSINSFAHLLREHLGADGAPEIQAYLDRIRSGSLKMAVLIDDLLEYSHIERRALSISKVDVAATVGSILTQCADEIQRRCVEVQLDLEPLQLLVDAEGLMLVLRNLIENALKYTRQIPAPSLRIRARREGAAALLEVADNGIGFDMAHHDQIFKIFQRLHRDDQYPGTGIGLALVRKAVERMGGRVWAQSEPGAGARFFVELRMHPIPASESRGEEGLASVRS